MKRVAYGCVLGLVTCGLIGCSLFLGGCEDAAGSEGLTVTPATATLSLDVNTVELTVTGGTGGGDADVTTTNAAGAIDLALPLVWSVTDTSLGNIAKSSGYTAIYARTAKNGDNIVTATDQYGNEGHVAIKQVTELTDADDSSTDATTTTSTTTTTTSTTTTTTQPQTP